MATLTAKNRKNKKNIGRTLKNNAIDNALRMARGHFEDGGDTSGSDSGYSGGWGNYGSFGEAKVNNYGDQSTVDASRGNNQSDQVQQAQFGRVPEQGFSAEAAKLANEGPIPDWAGTNYLGNEVGVRNQEISNAAKAQAETDRLNAQSRAVENAPISFGQAPLAAGAFTGGLGQLGSDLPFGNTSEAEQLMDAEASRQAAINAVMTGANYAAPGTINSSSFTQPNFPHTPTPVNELAQQSSFTQPNFPHTPTPNNTPVGVVNPYAEGQMPQPLGAGVKTPAQDDAAAKALYEAQTFNPSVNAGLRYTRDQITQNMGPFANVSPVSNAPSVAQNKSSISNAVPAARDQYGMATPSSVTSADLARLAASNQPNPWNGIQKANVLDGIGAGFNGLLSGAPQIGKTGYSLGLGDSGNVSYGNILTDPTLNQNILNPSIANQGNNRDIQNAVAAAQAPVPAALPPYQTELGTYNQQLPSVNGMTAQQYAAAFAGGDMSKIHGRIKYVNGAPKLEYYI